MADDEQTPLLVNRKRGQDSETDLRHREGETVTESGGTSWYASVFMVINAALGAGLLEFPYSFSKSGGVTAALVVQAVSNHHSLIPDTTHR